MPRKIKNCFYEYLTFEKMLEAHERAKKGKMGRYEVLKYELNLEPNIVNLVESIKHNKYKMGKYRVFTIREPKERVVQALPYVDRIVHQWYVEEFIKRYIVPKFIKDTFACINGRGTHKSVDKLQYYMRVAKHQYGDDYYILKMDIKKFFYNIDHNILFNIMDDYISDKKLLSFTKLLIDSDGEEVGIPIGNYTSQFFANIYLHKLDIFVKHQLRIKYYVRYMDDFILLLKDKYTAKCILDLIKMFLKNELKLSLNEKSRYYTRSFGADFCGYRIWETHRLIRNSSKKKMKKKIVLWNKLHDENKANKKDIVLSFNSWLGHVEHANSYNLKEKMVNKMSWLTKE